MSLSFHIMFAALGVVMPFFLLLSQGLYLRRKNPVYLALNKKWTTAFAITYAVGAVSGVVLTFGLGLFWPRFMDFAGPMIGMLRGRRDQYHRHGLFLGMMVATLAAPLMIFSGDHTARQLAQNEPAKLAAIEPLFDTQEGAPLSIGGYPDVEAGEMRYDIEIPSLLSVLYLDDPNATI